MKATPQERYEAAGRQAWRCWICGTSMIDRRVCYSKYELPCGPRQHLDEKRAMPRFNLAGETHTHRTPDCDRFHYGEPHAATYIDESGTVRAAHLSCAISVRSQVRRHGWDEESATERLRSRAGISATHQLRDNPVDNPQKAQLESATTAPRKAQPPSCTTPERLHSVEQQSLGTEVGDQLARARTCPNCGAPAPPQIKHPYTLECCGYVLPLERLMWWN